MARQHTDFRSPKLLVATALIGLAVLILLGNADGRAVQPGCPLGALVGAALQAVPSILLQAGLRALQTCVFDHQVFLQDFLGMLVSFWLLLFIIVGTALLRSSFTGKTEGSPTPSKYL
jgi:hypothetical protein